MAAQAKYKVLEAPDEDEDDRKAEIDGHEVERRDPYGHWHFLNDKGSRTLSGSFTSMDEIRKAIHRYEQTL